MARRAAAKTAEGIEQKLRDYRESGLSRRGYCEREGIPLTTMDYYQRRVRELRGREAGAEPRRGIEGRRGMAMAEVEVSEGRAAQAKAHTGTEEGGFTVVLANGRRLEMCGWGYQEDELARLIRVVERA